MAEIPLAKELGWYRWTCVHCERATGPVFGAERLWLSIDEHFDLWHPDAERPESGKGTCDAMTPGSDTWRFGWNMSPAEGSPAEDGGE